MEKVSLYQKSISKTHLLFWITGLVRRLDGLEYINSSAWQKSTFRFVWLWMWMLLFLSDRYKLWTVCIDIFKVVQKNNLWWTNSNYWWWQHAWCSCIKGRRKWEWFKIIVHSLILCAANSDVSGVLKPVVSAVKHIRSQTFDNRQFR